jgi:hypothetical protein
MNKLLISYQSTEKQSISKKIAPLNSPKNANNLSKTISRLKEKNINLKVFQMYFIF